MISPRRSSSATAPTRRAATSCSSGPPDQDAAWSDSGVEGVHRFLPAVAARRRAGATAASVRRREAEQPADPQGDALTLVRKANWAIDKVTGDIERPLRLQHRDRGDHGARQRDLPPPRRRRAARRFATATAASLLFPFAPHLGAEVYELLTGRRVWEEPWPAADPAMLQADTFELVCQVNGKVRDRVRRPPAPPREELERLRSTRRGVQAHVDGREVVKVIVVPDKLVNVVVR